MIIPLNKPFGVSTHSFVKAYGESIGEKVTHTGSLDPMAEGVVVVLSGEDRFKKEEMATVDKEYEFEMLVGFSTDSHDLLGLVDNEHRYPPQQGVFLQDKYALHNDDERCGCSFREHAVRDDIEAVISEFVGSYKQVIPRFSAKRIGGESYFDKAKRGEILEQEKQLVAVHTLDVVDTEED